MFVRAFAGHSRGTRRALRTRSPGTSSEPLWLNKNTTPAQEIRTFGPKASPERVESTSSEPLALEGARKKQHSRPRYTHFWPKSVPAGAPAHLVDATRARKNSTPAQEIRTFGFEKTALPLKKYAHSAQNALLGATGARKKQPLGLKKNAHSDQNVFLGLKSTTPGQQIRTFAPKAFPQGLQSTTALPLEKYARSAQNAFLGTNHAHKGLCDALATRPGRARRAPLRSHWGSKKDHSRLRYTTFGPNARPEPREGREHFFGATGARRGSKKQHSRSRNMHFRPPRHS